MKRFINVKIYVDNAAFSDAPGMEVSRILNTVARKIDDSDFDESSVKDNGFFVFDSNGNCCGKVSIGSEE
jgi:hypothetical protein